MTYSTADGTATLADGDYDQVTSALLTFNPGVTSQTASVTVNGDDVDELDETFTVNLSGATNATIGTAIGTGTITDDDPPPAVSIDSPSITEGDTGMQDLLTFTVTLDGPSGQTVTVDWATADGTAVDPDDYLSDSNTVTFTPGDVSETLTVAVVGDVLPEHSETFTVTLSNPSNATLGTSVGTGTVNDNGDPAPELAINDPGAVTEGNSTTTVTFDVTLSVPSGQTVTVDWTTADGSAVDPDDYTADSGTLTFLPLDTTESITITIIGDALNEIDETFDVVLSNPSLAMISDDTGTATILDDDP